MWVLEENGTKSNRCSVKLGGVSFCRIQDYGKKKRKEPRHTQEQEEKRQKHRTQQFPVGEGRIRGLKAGGRSGGASSGVSY